MRVHAEKTNIRSCVLPLRSLMRCRLHVHSQRPEQALMHQAEKLQHTSTWVGQRRWATLIMSGSLCSLQYSACPPSLPKEGCLSQSSAPDQNRILYQHVD